MKSSGRPQLNWPGFRRQIAIFGSLAVFSAVGTHLVGLSAGITSLLIGIGVVAAFSVLFNRAPGLDSHRRNRN